MAAKTIVDEVKRGLRPHLPFAAMTETDLDYLVEHVALAYFAPQERVLASGSVPSDCVIVKQGRVQASDPQTEAVVVEAGVGDCFPLGALMAKRPVELEYRSIGDTFCWLLPHEHFDELTRRSPALLDFSRRKLGSMLDRSREQLQQSYASEASVQRTMGTPLGELVHSPVTCSIETTLRTALKQMEDAHVGSVIVVDSANADSPVAGILTRTDLIGRVILPEASLDAPVSSVMTRDVRTLDSGATAADAILMMAEHAIRHVPILQRVENAMRVVGVVSERDLFALQRLTVRQVAESIKRAGEPAAVAAIGHDVRRLSHYLVAQGVSSAQVTRLISHLNDQLTERVLELGCQRFKIRPEALCWLAFGSEGRGEQTIATDQDNGLIGTGEASSERLLEFARWVNPVLADCGFPLCKGNIMASNPAWCRSFPEWVAQFEAWIDRGDPEALLASAIFFDLRPLFGAMQIGHDLRLQVIAKARSNPRFLKQMADNALRTRVPVTGRLIDALFENSSERVDLKLHGTVPFVEAARIWNLAAGIDETGTARRLSRAAEAGRLPARDVQGWIAAFEFFQLQRLRVQHRRDGDGAANEASNPNEIELAELSSLDRRIVNESFRQARKVQQRLELDFHG